MRKRVPVLVQQFTTNLKRKGRRIIVKSKYFKTENNENRLTNN